MYGRRKYRKGRSRNAQGETKELTSMVSFSSKGFVVSVQACFWCLVCNCHELGFRAEDIQSRKPGATVECETKEVEADWVLRMLLAMRQL
jgi:hypothetical protein